LKPDAVAAPNIPDGQRGWVWTGQNFSAWSGPSRRTDPAAHNDGLSRSCQRWRSPLSLVGGIGRTPRSGIQRRRCWSTGSR